MTKPMHSALAKREMCAKRLHISAQLHGFFVVVVLVVVTRPVPRGGGMVEDHGAPEAGQVPRTWTRGH